MVCPGFSTSTSRHFSNIPHRLLPIEQASHHASVASATAHCCLLNNKLRITPQSNDTLSHTCHTVLYGSCPLPISATCLSPYLSHSPI
ncbi:hypothetical protein ACOMHN_005772 [Nucella lapillus]